MLSRYGNAFTFAIYKICFVLCYNNDADTIAAVIREKQSIYETIYGKYILMLNTITLGYAVAQNAIILVTWESTSTFLCLIYPEIRIHCPFFVHDIS